MGAGKSRMNSAPCSKADFRNEETLTAIVSTHNNDNGNSGDPYRQEIRSCSMKNNGFGSVVGLNNCPMPQMEYNNVCVCNNAMENYSTKNTTDLKYSIDALTPEQQMEEIEKIYQEKTRPKAGEMTENYRRSSRTASRRTTCCNCNCNCVRTKKNDYQVEQRNGLQSISPLDEECQCRKCDKERRAQLSEAEAIADAITEYCCRARKKAEREKARNKHRCCKCNGEFKNNWPQQEMDTDYDDEETDTEPDIEIEVEGDCCCAQQRRAQAWREKCCKCTVEKKRQKQNRMEEDELEEESSQEEDEDNYMVEEEAAAEETTEEVGVSPAKQRMRQTNNVEKQIPQSRHAQPHAKRCRCCDCKRKHGIVDQSDEEEGEISVEDIELEVQEEQSEQAEKLSRSRPPQRSDGQEQEPKPRGGTHDTSQHLRENSRVKESVQRGLKQEKEVLLKKTNLYAQPKQSAKEIREKSSAKELQTWQNPQQNRNQESKTKPQRSKSEEVQRIRSKSHEQPHLADCRCCDCKKLKAEAGKQRRESTSGMSLNIEMSYEKQGSRRRRSEDEPKSRRSLSQRPLRERRSLSRGRESRSIADESQIRRNSSRGRRERPTREESNAAEIEEYIGVSSRQRKLENTPENYIQNRRQQERMENQQNSQASRSYRESMEGDEPSEASAAQQPNGERTCARRCSCSQRNSQASRSYLESMEGDEPSKASAAQQPNGEQTCARRCSCCASQRIIADQQPAAEPEPEADADMESEKQQNCCCFSRKRTQQKSGERRRSSSCKCKRKPKNDSLEDAEKPEKVKQHSEKECQTVCRCKKKKGVPLTKCCKCRDDEYEPAYAQSPKQRHREEDRRRRMLVEELAERLQKRAQQQIELQRRLQDQMRAKQRQRCCCDPPPCCFPQFPCCCEQPVGGFGQEERPSACCFPPPSPQMPSSCCCPPMSPPPYCFPATTPPCCYEPPPCYGQECPCCCQPMPFCYAASCSYTKPSASS